VAHQALPHRRSLLEAREVTDDEEAHSRAGAQHVDALLCVRDTEEADLVLGVGAHKASHHNVRLLALVVVYGGNANLCPSHSTCTHLSVTARDKTRKCPPEEARFGGRRCRHRIA